MQRCNQERMGAGARRRERSEAPQSDFGGLDALHRSRRLYSSGSAPAGHPSTLILVHYLERRCRCLFELVACPASPTPPVSCNDSMGKEIFLRRPPPSFDRDFEGDEHRRSHDTDEDWLPHVQDIFSGNFHVLIDMTGDSDSEVCHHLHTTGIITWH